jgi:hypothetical protein
MAGMLPSLLNMAEAQRFLFKCLIQLNIRRFYLCLGRMNFLFQAEGAGVFLQLLDESDKKETRIAVN